MDNEKEERLLKGILNREIEEVASALADGANPNVTVFHKSGTGLSWTTLMPKDKNPLSFTLLGILIEMSWSESDLENESDLVNTVKLLLTYGANPNITMDNDAVLNSALGNGLVDTARALLDAGYDIKKETEGGFGALHACGSCPDTLWDWMEGNDERRENIDRKKTRMLEEIAETMTKNGLDMKSEINKIARGGSRLAPINYAASSGFKNVLKKMLELGANPNRERALHGPLHSAAEYGHDECCEILINAGADLSEKNFHNNDRTPAQAARSEGFRKLAKALSNWPAHIAEREAAELKMESSTEVKRVKRRV